MPHSKFACCNVAVAPVRKDPSHRSEQTSQLLFGERCAVLEENENGWSRIRCAWDQYEGWCKASQFSEITRADFNKKVRYLVMNNKSRLLTSEQEMWLPMAAETGGIRSMNLSPDSVPKFKGKKAAIKNLSFKGGDIKEYAMHYLHAPYQWGGRTVAGIDCSGLVQNVYKLCGIQVPRDAAQQAEAGNTIDFLTEVQCGDLAFFDNEEGKIVHVGIMLDHHHIIHATETTGRVVIDRLDNGGIVSVMLKKRTHKLRVVKRIV